MHIHLRKIGWLLCLIVFSVSFFLIKQTNAEVPAGCVEFCPKPSSSDGYGGGDNPISKAIREFLFGAPPSPEDKAQARRMKQAWDRGFKCDNEKDYSCARKEYKVAWDNCNSHKNCKSLKKNISLAYRDEHWNWAYNYFNNKDFQNALAQYELAYGYCHAGSNKTCKMLKRGMQRTELEILFQKGYALTESYQNHAARQDFKKALKICKKLQLECLAVTEAIAFTNFKIELEKFSDKWIAADQDLENGKYSESLRVYEEIRKKCKSVEMCSELDTIILQTSVLVTWDKGEKLVNEGKFAEARVYLETSLQDCHTSGFSIESCAEIKKEIEIAKLAENVLLDINQTEHVFTESKPPKKDIENRGSPPLSGSIFKESIREKFENIDDFEPPDVEGICAYWVPQNCGDDNDSTDEDLEEINLYLGGAILGILPEQQKLDAKLEAGTITQEERDTRVIELEKDTHSRIKNLDRVLAEDKTNLGKEKEEIARKFQKGEITEAEKKSESIRIDATLKDIDDLQEGAQKAAEAIEERLIVMGAPILIDKDGNPEPEQGSTQE